MDKPMEIDFVGGGSRTQPLHGRQTHVTGAHLSRGVQYAWAAYADVINRIASSTELYGLNGDTRYSPMPRAERSSSRAQYRLRVGGDKVSGGQVTELIVRVTALGTVEGIKRKGEYVGRGPSYPMEFHESQPDIRAENLTPETLHSWLSAEIGRLGSRTCQSVTLS